MNQKCFDFIKKELEEANALCDMLDEENISVQDIRDERPEKVLLKLADLYGRRFRSLTFDSDKAIGIVEKAIEFHSGSEEYPTKEDMDGYKITYLQQAGRHDEIASIEHPRIEYNLLELGGDSRFFGPNGLESVLHSDDVDVLWRAYCSVDRVCAPSVSRRISDAIVNKVHENIMSGPVSDLKLQKYLHCINGMLSNPTSDAALKKIDTIAYHVECNYDGIYDPDGEIAYQIYYMDGARNHDSGRRWLEKAAAKGYYLALHHYFKFGHFDTLGEWCAAVEMIHERSADRDRFCENMGPVCRSLELPEDVVARLKALGIRGLDSSEMTNYYLAGNYIGCVKRWLSSDRLSSPLECGVLEPIFLKGLGTDADPDLAREIHKELKSGEKTPDLRRRAADAFGLKVDCKGMLIE